MNRIDRLFNILLVFQTKKRIRALDLAQQFEISERTVYRDISALMQMGIPIISFPGEGYELMEGYFLPPMVFSADEASALLLGINMLKASGNLPRNAEQAGDKIAAILPQRTLNHVKMQTDIIRFALPSSRIDLNDPQLWTIQQAVLEQRLLHIKYHSLSEDQSTERDVEPYELIFGGRTWYFEGYCRLRKGIRAFRLDRVEHLQLSNQYFEPHQIHQESPSQPKIIRVRFQSANLRWVNERQHYGFVDSVVESEETVMVTYQVDTYLEIRAWLLAWGSAAEVIEPPDLREEILQEAKLMVKTLT